MHRPCTPGSSRSASRASESAGRAGQFADSQAHMELRQSGIGGLYAPLVIDWNPARRRSPAFWRPLTVAQDGAAVPSGLAAACRLQVGYGAMAHLSQPVAHP